MVDKSRFRTDPADDVPTRLSARVVVGGGTVYSPGVVSIRDDLIEAVGAFEDGSPDFDSPDFDLLAPGFVDLQVNGIGRIDVARADGADWDHLGTALLAQGVTTWCPTLVTAPDIDIEQACTRVSLAMRATSSDRPAIAGVHLEGPFITVPGAHRVEYMRSRIDRGWVTQLDPVVRVVTLAPELPGALDAIGQLAGNQVLVSLGHSACTAVEAHDAADAGARLVTHLGNATGPFHQRSPGLLGAALADERLSVSLIADLEHVHSDLLRIAFSAKGPDRVVLVTDAVAAGAGAVGPVALDGEREEGAAARLADGTLAGSVLTMPTAVGNVVSSAQIAIADAIRAASTTPAALLGLDDRGAIAAGRRADLVALKWEEAGGEPSLRVEAVWLGGHLAWSAPRA